MKLSMMHTHMIKCNGYIQFCFQRYFYYAVSNFCLKFEININPINEKIASYPMELCVFHLENHHGLQCCCFLKSAIVKILVKDDYK